MLRYGIGVAKLILMGPMLGTAHWVEDANRLRGELPHDVRTILDAHESAGTTGSAAYRAAAVFDDLHVCRISPRPAAVLRAQENVGLAVYNYLWGRVNSPAPEPSKITAVSTISTGSTYRPCSYAVNSTRQHRKTTALYRDKVASADLHVFENTSHSPHHERSAEFLQVVEAFLNRDVTPSR